MNTIHAKDIPRLKLNRLHFFKSNDGVVFLCKRETPSKYIKVARIVFGEQK